MAKKQSLVGICFAGVQRLQRQYQCPPKALYLQWIGMAAKIQQRNEIVNVQCVKVQAKLNYEGFRCCVLKGQGLATYYGDMALLRQPGDIDVWAIPSEGKCDNLHYKRVLAYAKKISTIRNFNLQHVSIPYFNDTEVELHFTPSWAYRPFRNMNLQRWFMRMATNDSNEFLEVGDIKVPSLDFNVIYLLQHCYSHLMFEGIGLRQVMDYYFVLRYRNTNCCSENRPVQKTLKQLGLYKFAGAMMWILKEVFGLESACMICEPSEKEGRFLLEEILSGGNFGKYNNDKVMDNRKKGGLKYFVARIKHSCRILGFAPGECLSMPGFMLYHFVRKRIISKYI